MTKSKSFRSIATTMAKRRHCFFPSSSSCAAFSYDSPCTITTTQQTNPLHSFPTFHTKRLYSSTLFRNASLAHNKPMANNNNNDDGTNWQDWFGIEYENPWQGFRHLQDAALDQTTRFLIQQLQDLYHGILGPFDRPSTNQCKKVPC